jgi:Zn-dependent protease with chaperone function
MRKTLPAFSFLILLPLLSAQQPSVPAQPAPSAQPPAPAQPFANAAAAGQTENTPAVQFQFTKVDDALLAEADAVDREFEKKGLVLHDPAVQAYIDSVGNRVLASRPVPVKVTYRFVVLRDPDVNAFSLPNGSVYISTGLLALLVNEGELAGVLGHETAHVYERHSYLENRSIRKKSVTLNILAIVASVTPIGPGAGGIAGAAVYAAAEISSLVLVESVFGYSREMERQADSDGIVAMAAVGYNPHAMAATFELLDADRTLEYEPYHTLYHDHPKLQEREVAATEYADKHTPAGARIGSEKDYLAAVAPAIVSNINTDIESRRPRTAVARAARLVQAFPGDPLYQVLLGESYRALGAKTKIPTPDELTPDGEDKQRKLMIKMTEQQEQQKLLQTPEGRAMLKENQASAEKSFLAAIQNHLDYAPGYRELGFLYEDETRYADAATNYQHYLQLVVNTSLDHLRIERRLAAVQSLQAAQPPQAH